MSLIFLVLAETLARLCLSVFAAAMLLILMYGIVATLVPASFAGPVTFVLYGCAAAIAVVTGMYLSQRQKETR